MQARFILRDEGKDVRITIDPPVDDPPKHYEGKVRFVTKWLGRDPDLIFMTKGEARAIASALMGAAAEL